MALKYFQHRITGEIIRSLKDEDLEIYEELLIPPNQKFMVKTDEYSGKSKIKDIDGVLLERARSHSRDWELEDNVEINREVGSDEASINKNFLNSSGKIRTKLDDI